MEPIALIPELTVALKKVGRSLSPWDRLVRLEEQLLRRARAAFLVHWFGTGVPVERLNLSIVIVNIAELRRRLERVRESVRQPPTGMSLLGPLTGMAGAAVGYLMSPVGSILIAPYLHEILSMISSSGWMQAFGLLYTTVLNWLMPIYGPRIALFIGAPAALLHAFGLAIGGDRTTSVVIDLMHDLASLIDRGLALWDQITGPRLQVQNPLLRRLLDFLDRFAGLFAQILGFTAIIVVRVLPLVPNLLTQYRAFAALAEELLATLMEGVSGIADAIMAPFHRTGGILAVLTEVLDAIMSIPGALLDTLSNFLSDAATDLGLLFSSITSDISTYILGVKGRIIAEFRKTPFGLLIDLITGLMRIMPGIIAAIRQAYRTPGPPEPEDDGEDVATMLRDSKATWVFDAPEAIADVLDSIDNLTLPDLPDFSLPDTPQLPSLPDAPAIQARLGRAGPVDLAAEARTRFAQARADMANVAQPEEILARPSSSFGPEIRARRQRGDPSRTEADMRLRNALYLAVGRVLPGNLRIYAPALRSYFDIIDQHIYGVKPPKNPPHPQLELPDNGQLKPRVEKLRIRATGVPAADLRAFRDRLIDRLQFQDYRAAGAGAGAG